MKKTLKAIALLVVLCTVMAIPAMAMAAWRPNPFADIPATLNDDDFFVYRDPVVLADTSDDEETADDADEAEVPETGVVSVMAIASVLMTVGCAVLPKKK